MRCCIFVFNALHLVDLVMIGLVLRLPKFVVYYGFLVALVISVLAKRLAGKSVSDMTYTYIVSSGTLNLNSINQLFPSVFFSYTVLCELR